MTTPTTLTALADQADVIERLQEERAALALVLNAVPRPEHNAAVLSSGVNIVTYSKAMAAGLGREYGV